MNEVKQHYLENALYEYIQNHQHENIDTVDMVVHFKLSADITLEALSNLVVKNRVKREHVFGFQYRYATT